jgi:hypothetical protein
VPFFQSRTPPFSIPSWNTELVNFPTNSQGISLDEHEIGRKFSEMSIHVSYYFVRSGLWCPDAKQNCSFYTTARILQLCYGTVFAVVHL